MGDSKFTNENPSAFPLHPQVNPDWTDHRTVGMSLRDWFAGQIANGMAAHSGTAGISYGPGNIADRAYEIADAMLAARVAPPVVAGGMDRG